MPQPDQKILWVVVGAMVLVAASQLYLFSLLRRSPSAYSAPATAQERAAQPGAKNISTGSAILFLGGAVTHVESAGLIVKTDSGSVSVSVTSATTFAEQETLKSSTTQQAELDEYNALVQKLFEDPEKNKARLERMLPPPLFTERPILFSDLKEGDEIMIISDGKNSAGSYDALNIIKVGP